MSDPTSESRPDDFDDQDTEPEPNQPQRKPPKLARLVRLSEVLEDALCDAAAAHRAHEANELRGPISGFQALDRELSHAFAPGVHGVHGNAGAGKTAFTLQVAANCGFPCLYVTCEMAPPELLRRHAARVTSICLNRFKSGEMSPKEVEKHFRRACEAAPDLGFLDATRRIATPDHILKSAQVMQGDARQVLVVVDSLQSWAEGMTEDVAGNEYETLNAAVKALRGIAHQLNCPVLFVSERNREGMKSGGLNAGAGTRKIEYGTETVIDLDRDMNAVQDGSGEVSVTLRLSKNRHGAVGKAIPLLFHGGLQQFRENTGNGQPKPQAKTNSRPTTPVSRN